MATTIIRPKSREEWLEVRKSGIGSSEVATIVGLNPWETPYQLWRRKVGLDEPKPENFAMKAGHYLEDAVSRFWADETGKEIIKRSATDWIIRDNDRPFLQVSPDRTYWLGESRRNEAKGILECKTTQMKVDKDDLPKYWFCQVQYQLGVAGYAEGSLAWLCSGREFGYQDLKFVPDFYEGFLLPEVERFYTDCIIGGQEPDIITVQDVMLKYNRHTAGKMVEISDEVFEAYQNLKEVRREMDALDERKEELEATIKMAFGDAEAISYGGTTIATWKAPNPSLKFDSKAFTAAHPDLAKEFSSMTQGARRFLLK
ncbi:MAG: YqaJ viral recombinase family protein [Bacteroidaceae bacterium]|nr:YqaJ viral recombinase family protein [Bacteroidaceae bacterium]